MKMSLNIKKFYKKLFYKKRAPNQETLLQSQQPSFLKVGSISRGATPIGVLVYRGIPVAARVVGQFATFFRDYGSCFVNLALVMGLLYRNLS